MARLHTLEQRTPDTTVGSHSPCAPAEEQPQYASALGWHVAAGAGSSAGVKLHGTRRLERSLPRVCLVYVQRGWAAFRLDIWLPAELGLQLPHILQSFLLLRWPWMYLEWHACGWMGRGSEQPGEQQLPLPSRFADMCVSQGGVNGFMYRPHYRVFKWYKVQVRSNAPRIERPRAMARCAHEYCLFHS